MASGVTRIAALIIMIIICSAFQSANLALLVALQQLAQPDSTTHVQLMPASEGLQWRLASLAIWISQFSNSRKPKVLAAYKVAIASRLRMCSILPLISTTPLPSFG